MRNQTAYKINFICDDLNIPDLIKSQAIEIFHSNLRIFEFMQNNTVAGTALSLAVLCEGCKKKFSINKIAKSSKNHPYSITSQIYNVIDSKNLKIEHKIKNVESTLRGHLDLII